MAIGREEVKFEYLVTPNTSGVTKWTNVTKDRIDSVDQAHAMAIVEHGYREAARECGILATKGVVDNGIGMTKDNGAPRIRTPQEVEVIDVGTMFSKLAVDMLGRGSRAVEEARIANDPFVQFEQEFANSAERITI